VGPGRPRYPRNVIVWLHIGTPKSGTSYVQDVLALNRERLASDGVLWPGETWRDQVRAVRDVLDFFPNDVVNPAIKGWWDRLRGEILAWEGDAAVISMEWLVHARPHQVETIRQSLAPHEVRVVITARDLARALPAQWQEQVQNWAVWTWEEYQEAVTSGVTFEDPPGRQFWIDHDLGRMLRNWSEGGVPREHITVVTVPGRDAPPDLLWQRFAEVLGLGAGYETKVAPSNTSIGVPSAELLRRLNVTTREAGLDWAFGDPVVKWVLAKRILGPRRPKEYGLKLPTAHREWAEHESHRLIADVEAAGVRVVGDLQELMPEESTFADAPSPSAEDLLDAALDGLTGLVMQIAERVEMDMRPPPPPPPTGFQRVMRSKPMKPVAFVGLPVRDALRRMRTAADRVSAARGR
jgi:hypothetical protein